MKLTRRRTPRRVCSDQCKGDTWALRKAADLLSPFSTEKKLEILEAVIKGKPCESSQTQIDKQYKNNVGNQREKHGETRLEINMKSTCQNPISIEGGRRSPSGAGCVFVMGFVRLMTPRPSALLSGLMGLEFRSKK